MNFEKQLLDMLKHQIVDRGITNPRILEAMQRAPRHLFVPEEYIEESYQDRPIALSEDRATISQPYMVAYMTEVLQLETQDRVCEIGTGSGYQTAILSMLCKEVYTIERHYSLSVNAQRTLQNLGIHNVQFQVGDGYEGWAEYAPYDKIIVTAASKTIPHKMIEQIHVGGMIVIPIGDSQMQTLTRAIKTEDGLMEGKLIPCVFVPLISQSRDLTQSDNIDNINID